MAKIINRAMVFLNKVKMISVADQPDFLIQDRPYQLELRNQYYNMGDVLKPIYICWCRRAGKDAFAFKIACEQALKTPNSRIMYLFPTKLQGKSAILEGVFLDNKPFISSIINPKHLKRPKNGALYHYDNTIRFKNGSIISIVGDDGDSLVGGNANLLVCSEAAMISKKTIDYLVPSILKIKGKVILVSSPRYGSHFNETILNDTGNIIASVLPANIIVDENGERVYSDEDLEVAKGMMSIERFRSEYMVDLSSHNESSIYGRSFEMAEWVENVDLRDMRIFISADLGISDNSAFTFGIQDKNGNVIVIHQYRNRGKASQFYIDYIKKWLADHNIPLHMVTMILPHDAAITSDSGRILTSRLSFYESAGFRCAVLRPISVLRAIEITRASIQNGKLKFLSVESVRKMTDVIKGYEWKTQNGVSLGVPNHGTNYAPSNDADSLEYLTLAFFLDDYDKEYKTESGVIIK